MYCSKYTLCDLTLLGQIYYYRWKRSRVLSYEPDEQAPLLPGESRSQPVSTRMLLIRYTAALLFVFATGIIAWWISSSMESKDEHSGSPEKSIGWRIQIVGWSSAVLYVSKPASFPLAAVSSPKTARRTDTTDLYALLSSSSPTLMFLPLAVKNFKTRCEGLSPALFLFAIFGNLTYVLSICTKSMSRHYLITNASWLAGGFRSLTYGSAVTDRS